MCSGDLIDFGLLQLRETWPRYNLSAQKVFNANQIYYLLAILQSQCVSTLVILLRLLTHS